MPEKDSSAPCEHMNFKVEAKVGRLTEVEGGPVTGFTTEITVNCLDCFKPFVWVGVPMGYSPNQPMVSVDGMELRAPIKPII